MSFRDLSPWLVVLCIHTIISLKIDKKRQKRIQFLDYTFYLKIWIKTNSFQFYPSFMLILFFFKKSLFKIDREFSELSEILNETLH